MNRRSFLGWAGKAAVAVGLLPVAAEAAEAAPQTGIQFAAQNGVLSIDNGRLTVIEHASAMGGIVAGAPHTSGWVKIGKGQYVPYFS